IPTRDRPGLTLDRRRRDRAGAGYYQWSGSPGGFTAPGYIALERAYRARARSRSWRRVAPALDSIQPPAGCQHREKVSGQPTVIYGSRPGGQYRPDARG